MGRFLKDARRKSGLSLQDVERITRTRKAHPGVLTASYLSRLETGKTELTIEKGRTLVQLYRVPLSQMLDQIHLDQFEKLRPSIDRADRLMSLGRRAAEAGDWGRAFAAYEKAQECATTSERRAQAGCNKLLALRNLGFLDHVLRGLVQILEDPQLPDPAKLAVYHSLAETYQMRGNPEYARQHAETALALARQVRDKAWQAACLNLLGDICRSLYELGGEADRARLTEAARHFESGLRSFKARKDRERVALATINLGSCYLLQGDPARGIRLQEQGLALARKSRHKWSTALALKELGKSLFRADRLEEAETTLEEGIALAEQEGYHDLLFGATFYLARLYQRQRRRIRPLKRRMREARDRIQGVFPELLIYDREYRRGER